MKAKKTIRVKPGTSTIVLRVLVEDDEETVRYDERRYDQKETMRFERENTKPVDARQTATGHTKKQTQLR